MTVNQRVSDWAECKQHLTGLKPSIDIELADLTHLTSLYFIHPSFIAILINAVKHLDMIRHLNLVITNCPQTVQPVTCSSRPCSATPNLWALASWHRLWGQFVGNLWRRWPDRCIQHRYMCCWGRKNNKQHSWWPYGGLSSQLSIFTSVEMLPYHFTSFQENQ